MLGFSVREELMQKKIIVLILAVVIVFSFCIVRDLLIKSLIGTVASSVTGAPVEVGGLSLGIMRQAIKISNFRMYNPQGFPRDILVDIPRIRVAWDLGALFKGRIHLRQLDIEIKELGLAKNKEGKLNVDSLKITGEKQPADMAVKKPTKQLAMQIDIVNLTMGRIVNKDYSVEGPPLIKVYDINLNKGYKNITSAQQLAVLLVSEPLKAAGIQGLKLYGAAMLTGVAVLPVAAVFTFTGKDFTQNTLGVSFERAYDAGLKALKDAGVVKKENKGAGVISAEVDGSEVTLKLKRLSEVSTEVTISARKFGLPQPAVASGVLYRLEEKLK
jgi:hypothetical protein